MSSFDEGRERIRKRISLQRLVLLKYVRLSLGLLSHPVSDCDLALSDIEKPEPFYGLITNDIMNADRITFVLGLNLISTECYVLSRNSGTFLL